MSMRGWVTAITSVGMGLSVVSAFGGNMAFKLDVGFPCTANNDYLMSLPLLHGVQDRADSSDLSDKCEPVSGPDGTIDTYDLLCQLFSDRGVATATGTGMTITVFEPATCLETAVTAFIGPGGVGHVGVATSLDELAGAGRAFTVRTTCGAGETAAIENQAALVGAHDVTFQGRVLGPPCVQDRIAVPYHTLYRTADELLCGLEGVDWVDADGNGNPDTCVGGIFHSTSGAPVLVQRHENDPSGWIGRTAFGIGAGLMFIGTDFALVQGEGIQVNWSPGFPWGIFLSPHY